LNSIMSVAMPHFATQVRNNENIANSYLSAITHLSVVGWPFFLLLSLLSPQLIPTLYGDQWHDAAPLAQLLCLAELSLVPFYLLGQVIIAKGKMGFQSLRTLFGVTVRILIIYFLAPFGLLTIAIGLTISSIAIAVMTLPIALHILECKLSDFGRALYPSFKVSIIYSLLVLTVSWLMNKGTYSPLLHLLVISIASTICWFFSLWIFKHQTLAEILQAINHLSRKLRKA